MRGTLAVAAAALIGAAAVAGVEAAAFTAIDAGFAARSTVTVPVQLAANSRNYHDITKNTTRHNVRPGGPPSRHHR